MFNFPLQFGIERKLINNKEEFYYLINKYNGYKNLYCSIYDVKIKKNVCGCFTKKEGYHACETKLLNKIIFDIDIINEELMLKIHNFLYDLNIKHTFLFSSRKGFHIYIYTKDYENLKNPKKTLLNVHNYFIQCLELKTKDITYYDRAIIGDINRLIRIPNTLNPYSKLFCIPITIQDLKNKIFLDKAKYQNFNFTFYGSELFSLKKFDNFNVVIKPELNAITKIDISIDKKKLLQDLPPCIKNILLSSYVFWRQRFYVLKFLLHSGFSDTEINFIMKTFLLGKLHPIKKHDNYVHYLQENQFYYVKANSSVFACNKVKQDDLCPVTDLCDEIMENPLYI